ncbi:MAG TPA: GntR family transcriptional regulator [Anaerolineales bacterium]|jgi:GntR family transcriptional regulator|nr:GntR family transcriptional regulator [Anaerolineales bacterium]
MVEIGKTLPQQLHERLRKLISETEPGGRLPSEPKLAKQLGVSRATLREAMRIFETQGVIHRRQGVGTFVIPPSQVIETGLEVLESILTQAKRKDLPIRVGPTSLIERPATENEVELLNIKPGSSVLQISWVMETPDRPVAYLVDVLPAGVLSLKEARQNFNGSVLDLLMNSPSLNLTTSRTELGAVAAPPEIAKSLGIQRGDVVLCFEATLYTAEGRVVDYSHSYYLPGYFRFHVVRRVG